MKTSQEKAKEIFDTYYSIKWMEYKNRKQVFHSMPKDIAKQCALIAVDEIIRLHKGKFMCEREEQNEEYWQQVKQEIEKS